MPLPAGTAGGTWEQRGHHGIGAVLLQGTLEREVSRKGMDEMDRKECRDWIAAGERVIPAM